MKTRSYPASRRCAAAALAAWLDPHGRRLPDVRHVLKSSPRFPPRRCARSSRTQSRRARARRSGAPAPRRSGTGRGRLGGSRLRCGWACPVTPRRPRSGFRRPASRTTSRCETDAPESGGIGGDVVVEAHPADPTARPRAVRGRRRSSTSRRTHERVRAREVADDDAGIGELRDDGGDSSAGTRHETRVARSSGTTTSAPDSLQELASRSAVAPARSNRHAGCVRSATRRPTRAAFGVRFGSKRAAPDFGSKAPSGS